MSNPSGTDPERRPDQDRSQAKEDEQLAQQNPPGRDLPHEVQDGPVRPGDWSRSVPDPFVPAPGVEEGARSRRMRDTSGDDEQPRSGAEPDVLPQEE